LKDERQKGFFMWIVKLPSKSLLYLFCFIFLFSCGGSGESDTSKPLPIINAQPVVNAGVDQSVNEQQNIILVGTATDSDGSIVSYQWQQTSGVEVTLIDETKATASFIAPVTNEKLVLTFELTATDNQGASVTDSVIITVTPIIKQSEVQMVETNYVFGCSSNTEAVAWFDDSIAVVMEGESAKDLDHETMTRIVKFFHRLYDKYEEITGLNNLPLDSPWQERVTIQIPLDNCGAGGLAHHGIRGISVGRGLFDIQYDISKSGQERYHQVFLYESNRNFWLPAFNNAFDWAMNNEPMNWGWWTVGMNNAMAVMMTDLLEVELEYFGHDSVWFRDRMLANLETYLADNHFDFDNAWRQEYMTWDPTESVNDLMSGFILHSYETWGGEAWLKAFYQNISTVTSRSDVFAFQECRNNIYLIWSAASGQDLRDYFTDQLRWEITVDLNSTDTKLAELNYSLADVLAGGNGSFPGTGRAGFSVIDAFDNKNFATHYGVVDGAFVPQSEGLTVISTSGLSFDFSDKVGIAQHDFSPTKGPTFHTDPSLQEHNLGTNPDYSGDANNHAYIDMHAAVGLTYNLNKLRSSYGGEVNLTQFTARFGTATGAKINYWVLLDGVVTRYGELLTGNIEAQDVDIVIDESDTFLTLVIGDANVGNINNAHGYIGDPVLHGMAAQTTKPSIPTNPINQSKSAFAWQSLNWNSGLGVNNYDIYLWPENESQPDTPNYSVNVNSVTPYEYLDFGGKYAWKIISNLANESLISPQYTFTVQQHDAQSSPRYNISPMAQELRTANYTLNGIEQILGEHSNITNGMRIGFYGDSNTDVIVWQQSLVSALTAKGAISLNRGINGADTQGLWDGVRQYDAGEGLSEPEPFAQQIITDNIEVAVIYIGINDVLNNVPATPTVNYKSLLNKMVQACINNNIKVVLVAASIYNEKPDGTNVHDSQLDEYQQAAKEVALDHGVSFIPARTHFLNYLKNHNFRVLDDGSVIHPYETGLLNSDVVHHNDTGKVFLSDLVADGIQRVLSLN